MSFAARLFQRALLEKTAFIPPPQAAGPGGAPVGPAGPGPAQPGMMDPAAMGAPADPAAMGAPMDPAVMGGAAPAPADPAQGGQVDPAMLAAMAGQGAPAEQAPAPEAPAEQAPEAPADDAGSGGDAAAASLAANGPEDKNVHPKPPSAVTKDEANTVLDIVERTLGMVGKTKKPVDQAAKAPEAEAPQAGAISGLPGLDASTLQGPLKLGTAKVLESLPYRATAKILFR